MIIGSYAAITIVKYGWSWTSIGVILGMIAFYFIVNMIVVKSFTNEKQRDLFGLIFTLGGSLIIENIVNLIYGPNAVSITLWNRTVRWLIIALVIINIVIVYLFHTSYNGKIRQAIYAQTSSVRSLGVRVNRMLILLMSAMLPCLVMLWVIVANEWAIKPSDNLFYLIKWIGIMIMVGVEKKQYVYLGALVYVTIEYLLFIQRWLPIGFKETLILFMILIILLVKPEWLFSLKNRKI
jgi:branched-subunit amino acid ABC-type transport system permease component